MERLYFVVGLAENGQLYKAVSTRPLPPQRWISGDTREKASPLYMIAGDAESDDLASLRDDLEASQGEYQVKLRDASRSTSLELRAVWKPGDKAPSRVPATPPTRGHGEPYRRGR